MIPYFVKSHEEFRDYCVNVPIKLHRKPELGKKYETVFIDFRALPHTKHVIYNCINKLSNDWSHTIVCGESNYEFMKKLISNSKVKIIKIDKEIKNVNDYNNLLLSTDFWNLFTGEKLLIYQEDTFLFHGDIHPFVEYDYIGAPWVKDIIPGGYGGNGGLSLRTKNIMIECLTKSHPPKDDSFTRFDKQAEDLYFCNTMCNLKIGKLAHRKVAVKFSQEQLISHTPMGGHKFWDARDHYDFVDIPYKIPAPIVLEKTKIPRNFIQTFRDNHVHKEVYDNIKGILNKNKGFNYMLINDSDGVKIMEKHFDQRTIDAFNKLRAGAAKGDFIRYITMYVYGGMYLDMDAIIVKNMSCYLNYDFVWIYDGAYNIIQWFFMSSPKHPILKQVIEEMVNRIHNNEQNIFLATGPTLISDIMFSLLTGNTVYNSNKHIKIPDRKQLVQSNTNFMNGLIMFEEIEPREVIFTFPGYNKEMLYDQNNPRYIPIAGGQKTPNLYK